MSDALPPPLPSEPESEATLLSYLFDHPETGIGPLQGLPLEAFHHPHHRAIARLIYQHTREGRPWDATIIIQELMRCTVRPDDTVDERAKQVLLTCHELANDVPCTTPASLQEHRRRMLDAHHKRRLHEFLVHSAGHVLEGRAESEDVFAHLEDFKRSWSSGSQFAGQLNRCLMSDVQLQGHDTPQRPRLLGDFFKEGDLGFIYAPRGVGKTWLAMMIASARAANRPLGQWGVGEKAGRVLYIDGEMHLADTKMRSTALGEGCGSFFWLHGDVVFESTKRVLNLCDREWQDHITELCRQKGITEIYLDNLSCLMRGMDENDNDHWRELVLPWLLELRRMRVSVVIVAHAGRAEHMRGASGKEDQAIWVMKLAAAGEDMRAEGAAFTSEFTKSRNTVGTPPALLWRIHTAPGQPLTYTCKLHGAMETLVQLVHQGVSKNRELAEPLNVKPGTVTKWAQKAKAQGLIRIQGGYYYPLGGTGDEGARS